MQKTKLYVISGTVEEFDRYARSKYDTNVTYIRVGESSNTLAGIENPDGVFIGSWMQRKDIAGVLLNLSLRMRDTKKQEAIKKIHDIYLSSLQQG